MKLRDFPLLTDQNIHTDVVAFLRGEGFDVIDVQQAGLLSAEDSAILSWAVKHGRVIVTHDADFGMLAIRTGAEYLGMVHLRPGHISPQVTIRSMHQLIELDIDVTPPFILTAKRSDDSLTVRIRSKKT